MISPEMLPPGVPGAALAVLAQAAVLPDTIVTVQAGATGLAYWVDLLTSIASIVIALALIAIAIPVIPAAWHTRKLYGKMNSLAKGARRDLDPVVRHATAVADNLNYITTALRADVEMLNRTVASANQRVNRVAALAEQRVNELNALLRVVQEEAEDIFIDTASTVRGVQVGAEAFRSLRTDEEYEDAYGGLAGVDEEYADDEYDGPDEPEDGLEINVRRG